MLMYMNIANMHCRIIAEKKNIPYPHKCIPYNFSLFLWTYDCIKSFCLAFAWCGISSLHGYGC